MTQYSSEINFRCYRFMEQRQKKSLQLLAIVQKPSRSGSEAVIEGIKKSKKGGFAYRLEEFLYEAQMLDKNDTISCKDVNAIAPYCEIVGYDVKKPLMVYLLVNMNAAENLSPGIFDRLNKDDTNKLNIQEADLCSPPEALSAKLVKQAYVLK